MKGNAWEIRKRGGMKWFRAASLRCRILAGISGVLFLLFGAVVERVFNARVSIVEESSGIPQRFLSPPSALPVSAPSTPIQDAEALTLRFMHQLHHLYGGRRSNPLAISYSRTVDSAAFAFTSASNITADDLAASALTPYSNFSYINGPRNTIFLPMMCQMHRTIPADRRVIVRSVMAQFFEKPALYPATTRALPLGQNDDTDGGARGPIHSSSRAQQCLEASAHMSVLVIDRGAFARIVDVTAAQPSNSKVILPKPDPAFPHEVIYNGNFEAGVEVNDNTSRALERAFGFDNTHLYRRREGDHSPFPATEKVEDSGAWSSATFYTGPASDALLPNHPNASVREAWARRKVDWVPTKNPHETDSYDYWWDYDDEAEDGNMPCTQYIQHRLHALMNPYSCDTMPKPGDFGGRDPFSVLDTEEGRGNAKHTRYFVSELRDKSRGQGVGASVYMAAHDFLVAMVLKRVVIQKLRLGKLSSYNGRVKWSYSSDVCAEAGRPSTDCYYQYPSHCQYKAKKRHFRAPWASSKEHALTALREALSVQRKHFEGAPGLGRADFPSDKEFFGSAFVAGGRGGNSDAVIPRMPKCYERYLNWTRRDRSHYYATDSVAKAEDPRLNYMESQVVRYMLRYQQPWFYNMLSQGLGKVGMGRGVPTWRGPGTENSKAHAGPPAQRGQVALASRKPFASFTLHERGEIEKYREHHSAIGCHTVKMEMMVDLVSAYCGYGFPTAPSTQFEQSKVSSLVASSSSLFVRQGLGSTPHLYHPPCHVFISGNTPTQNYKQLQQALIERARQQETSNPLVRPPQPIITSTWDLFANRSKSNEAANYGASSASAGWIDLYAGASATHWNCIGHSNWCRMFNYLRETSGRAVCGGFVDTGMMMLSSARLREAYCYINPKWPRSPFAGCRRPK